MGMVETTAYAKTFKSLEEKSDKFEGPIQEIMPSQSKHVNNHNNPTKIYIKKNKNQFPFLFSFVWGKCGGGDGVWFIRFKLRVVYRTV